jgi:hypothetical protein
MIRFHKQQPRNITRNPVYQVALEKLNNALEQNTEHPNTERIRLIRMACFADVDAMDEIKLPERRK